MIIRPSLEDELEQLQAFLVEQGSNQWNYLPEDGVNEQFRRLTQGSDHCLVAVDKETVVGMAIYRQPGDAPNIFAKFVNLSRAVYVAEVVVHSEFTGKGIGTSLMKEIIIITKELGAKELVIDRHEQNLASAGMMRKVGFKELDCFVDLRRRETGSQKTSILNLKLQD